ncbi:hypothetical protein [Nocardioides panacisoli]
MNAWTPTRLISGVVGISRTVHPGGRCIVCERRFRDLDRHWTTAHQWFTAPAGAVRQLSPESSSPSMTTTW